jgi:lincosamide nucleotidyltransferase
MLRQEAMIERVRELCREDERLVAAMMYGSFTRGEGDEFSDIDFILFFEDNLLDEVDDKEWVSCIAPVEMYYVNGYGIGTAIFENLVRGEFHFDKASNILKISESADDPWYEIDRIPSLDAALILDRTGELRRRLRTVVGPPLERDRTEDVRFLCREFVNWFLFGSNLLARGEFARALDLLGAVNNQLLRMARISERSTAHWFHQSKLVEKELSEASYARYVACTAPAKEEDLRRAYRNAWEWGRELIEELGGRHGVTLYSSLLDRIGERAGVTR